MENLVNILVWVHSKGGGGKSTAASLKGPITQCLGIVLLHNVHKWPTYSRMSCWISIKHESSGLSGLFVYLKTRTIFYKVRKGTKIWTTIWSVYSERPQDPLNMGSEVLFCNSNNSRGLYRSGVNSNRLLFPGSYFIFKLNIAYANNFWLSEKICVCHDIARVGKPFARGDH